MKQSEKNKRIIVGLFIIAVIICVMIVVYCVTHADFVIDTTDAQAKQLATSSTVQGGEAAEIVLAQFTDEGDAITIDGEMYDGSANGTSMELLLKLDELDWNK